MWNLIAPVGNPLDDLRVLPCELGKRSEMITHFRKEVDWTTFGGLRVKKMREVYIQRKSPRSM